MKKDNNPLAPIPEVYEVLKGYFREQRITNNAIAEKIDSHPVFVCSVLAGRKPIGRTIARRLHDAYGFSEIWLTTGKGDMFDTDYQTEKDKVPSAPDNKEDVMSVLLSNIKLQNLLLEGLKRDVDNLAQMMLEIYKKEGLLKDVK